jgi:hypothetical protein
VISFAVLALALQLAQPRWTALHDIRLGGTVDDILAKGGECRPGDAIEQLGGRGAGMSLVSFAQLTFGYALPHPHPPADSAAIRRALGIGTICRASLDSSSRVVAAAVDRRIVAMLVFFTNDAGPLPVDSVRHLAYAAWGRPTHHSPTLDTWSSARYRSYYMVPYRPPSARLSPYAELILLDIAACTAFDHRVHRAGAPGEAGEC